MNWLWAILVSVHSPSHIMHHAGWVVGLMLSSVIYVSLPFSSKEKPFIVGAMGTSSDPVALDRT